MSPPYFSFICNTVYSNKDRNVSAFIAVFLGSKVFIFLWEDINNLRSNRSQHFTPGPVAQFWVRDHEVWEKHPTSGALARCKL